jgi:hypothetical protein
MTGVVDVEAILARSVAGALARGVSQARPPVAPKRSRSTHG